MADNYNFTNLLSGVNGLVNLVTGIDSYIYNKNLSRRQQEFSEKSFALSEEQYRNGIVNSARQYQELGINPASVLSGQSTLGSTMSGGSSVSGSGLDTSLISALISAKSQENIAKMNNETTLKVHNDDYQLAKAESEATISKINSETAYNEWYNDYVKNGTELLRKYGIEPYLLDKFSHVDWQVAVACGFVGFITELSNSFTNDPDVDVGTSKEEVQKSIDSATEFMDLPKDVVDCVSRYLTENKQFMPRWTSEDISKMRSYSKDLSGLVDWLDSRFKDD